MTAAEADRRGGLQPLDPELNRECREFAEALRGLFLGLGVSVRRYASRCYLNPGTLSRYLAGSRIAPWEFVEELLRNLADDHAVRLDEQARAHLQHQHRAALRTSASIGRAVQQLEGQLHAADREARQAGAREEQLDHALDDTRQSIADLEGRLNRLEADLGGDPAAQRNAEGHSAAGPALLAERDALAVEVARLSEELDLARQHAALAEARCALLERQLLLVEQQQGADAAAAPPARTVTRPDPGPPPKVLLVDDRPENLLVLEAVLGLHGHELVSAASGPDALRALLDPDDYAVILLDVQMPGMDGYETAAHIKRRARTRDIPIIFVTAIGSDPDHSMRGYAAGAVDFIPKPVDPWALRAKVAVFVELHRERRHRR
ncbi:PleD family two-component system response regulator [Streptomyces sp. TLI_171]|uniref:response regulator n=1 Tax=Streptomyces sp. TLI_171 TaxID=1938859 RepID=UPI000C36689E|nr:response regulator [Streptomyces sp. TLI_171]RKE22980.1 response regulator receiver domain-containing protein [Streptomyces sp. TLI_171]